jgi:hypothetical protein
MLIFYINGIKYIYLHIPKNSGTYIRNQICSKVENAINYNLLEETDVILPENILEEIKNLHFLFYHFSYSLIKSQAQFSSEITPDCKYITFVRNPYNKLISGYFYKYYIKKTPEYKTITFNALKDENNEEFTTLVADLKRVIKENLLEYSEKDLFFRQQYKYVTDENANIPDDITIYKLEEYETNVEAQDFFKFENFNIKRYDYSDYYDNECLSIINEVYKKDFELLGYQTINTIN